MKLRTAVYAGISASVVSIFAFTIVFGVSLSDVISIGPTAFLLASLVSILRLAVQGVRFHELARGVNGSADIKLGRSTVARMASEFTDLVIPSYAGGEAVKIPWLVKKGLNVGQAILVAYFEVLFDVVIGGLISVIAAIYLIARGAYLPALVLLVLSALWIGFFVAVPWLVSRGRRALPNFLINMLSKIVGAKRAESLVGGLDKAALQSSQAAKTFLKSSKIVIVKVSLLTLVMVVLAGMIFWIVALGKGLEIDLFASILAVYVSYTIGAIPLTPGGSGLTEGGIGLFTSSLYGGEFWAAIIAWRITSYHVPLFVTGMALLYLSHKELSSLSLKQNISERQSSN
ncbi:MAG: flippase-like domain-containing protein [Thaumarchaeota archaeon]|nr:flippase-like domain-containing protein [Nitrososphaerota archaeon]